MKTDLAVPGSNTSTSLSPNEYAFNGLPLMWGPGAVVTKLGSCVTSIRPFGGIVGSLSEDSPAEGGHEEKSIE